MNSRVVWTTGMSVALMVCGAAHAQGPTESVPVFVNGERLDSDAILLKRLNRTVLPMRTLFEALGAQVEWDPSQRAVYAWRDDGTGVRLALGQKTAQTMTMHPDPGPGHWGRITGRYHLDAVPMMRAGRVYVPLRFASESLKADVRFSAFDPGIHIQTQAVAGTRQEQPLDEPVVRRPRPEPLDDEPVVRRPRPIPEDEPVVRRPRPIPEDEPVQVEEVTALDVTLEMEKGRLSLRNDREIVMRLVVRNPNDDDTMIPFRSGERFDFELVQDGQVVWNLNHGKAFTQALSSFTLRPGESKVFLGRFRLRDNEGDALRPGRYQVRAIFKPDIGRRPIVIERPLRIDP